MRVRKSLTAVAVALVAALAAAGCGGSGSGDSGKKTVTMWIYPVIFDEAKHRAFWDETVKAFQAQHPDIQVKTEIFPWANRDQALATAIAGNKGPDVVYLIPDQLPKYARNIEPVDAYLDDAAKSDYLDNVVKSVTIDGKMMGAPILTSAVTMMCNKKVFEAVGQTTYPATWNDLLTMAPAFKAKGYDVTAYPGDVKNTLNQTFYPLLWQAGGDVFSPDGKSVAFNSDAGRKALTFVKQLVDGGYVDKTLLTTLPPTEQTRIAQNKVACLWHSAPQEVEQFWGKENIKVLPPLTETKQIGYGTVGSLAMLKGAKDKKAAGEWIAYASGADVTKKYDTASSFFSPKKSAGTLFAGDPVLGEQEKYVGVTTVGPLHEKARDVQGVLAPEIQAALLGKKSVDQALSDAAKAADALLG
ncbi:sugar ABC transporter substrate-binding protein [Micromonospora sp. DR5-3]|uniref:ABC transporter substrate-binding protein n=1 Tax=unclassified Micromonospora TaxID=2617518 RepID=UPI0011DA60C9|nr:MULTISPECIES: sugar ABC transporter substrate-binding protein [unclassified Micromonospora]MCW3819228.1 sugar ABC transporter substrate-binding protein [Micromonospora sp. DR5-3]TYC20988.1 sugar ABC transporter substrate-binding protein [Micromonospora sp. MP36]